VAEEMARKLGSVEKVVVVPSTGFADALAVGPLAAAKGWPLLLADEDGDLPRKTSSAIANLQVESALVVGLETELELDEVERQLGDDSDQTAALVAAYAAAQGLSFAHTVIVGGDNFPEALVVTPYVALEKGMMLLAKQGALPAETRALLEENLADVMRLDFIALPALAKAMATSASRETSTSTTGSRTTTTTE
jgi:putative cell wall-binding protein